MSIDEPTASSDRVATYLREAILSGTLAPGDRIRQEEVATRLGASRVPVREALRILTAEGLTEHAQNKGARVARLSQHEVEVVYRMRERLEPVALVESLTYLDDADYEQIADVQARIAANRDVEKFLDLDREFHMLTYSGCRIQTLMAAVTQLWNVTQHYRRLFVSLGSEERLRTVNLEHELILDAVRRADGQDAERYLGGHIRRTRIELGRYPEVFG